MRPQVPFTGLVLDRASSRRQDETWIQEQSTDPGSRFVPVWGSEVLVSDGRTPRAILLSADEADSLCQEAESVIWLGERRERSYFAVGLKGVEELSLPRRLGPGEFRQLRGVAVLLDQQEAGLLAYATAMTYWHQRNQFCGDCGRATTSSPSGHLRVCTNDQCGRHHFPRTDPAIIVRVTHRNRCLLGRQPTWPQGLYSIIAGFVEPGESLEAAVVRELWEETGIRVTGVRYHSSQPWPFPSSLMLGFTAEARSTTLRPHDGELEDAQWLSREDIVSQLGQGILQLPSEISISRRLIADWFDAGEFGCLRHHVGSK